MALKLPNPRMHLRRRALFDEKVVDMSAWNASLYGQLVGVSEGSSPPVDAQDV